MNGMRLCLCAVGLTIGLLGQAPTQNETKLDSARAAAINKWYADIQKSLELCMQHCTEEQLLKALENRRAKREETERVIATLGQQTTETTFRGDRGQVTAQAANLEAFGLNSQDSAEVARLRATQVFKEIGGPLFQGVELVRTNAALYSRVDEEAANCVLRGGAPIRCAKRAEAEKARILAAHDEAKGVVLRACENGKAASNGSTMRELLLKMFRFAGVECSIPR